MKQKETSNDSAFASASVGTSGHLYKTHGLTKREYIAIENFNGLISAGWTDFETAAKGAVISADILLKHLNA